LAFACSFLGTPGELDLATASAQQSAQDCVGFDKVEADRALLFRAKSSCERRLDCALNYTLRCEDTKGRVTSSTQARVAFQLASRGERELTLSAASCKQGFRIEGVDWKCW
jgi:hypothetical protein